MRPLLCFAVALASILTIEARSQPPQRPSGITPPVPSPRTADTPPEPTAVVRGHVVGSDGRPLRQARISIVDGTARRTLSEATDADGAYEIAAVPAGTYAVTARKVGYTTVEFGQRRPSDAGRRVRVADGETLEHIDFTLPAASAINGRVVDENGDPVEDATVSIYTMTTVDGRRRLISVGSERRTDDLGRFRLFNIAPGSYVLAATVAATGTHRLPGYASTYFPGVQAVAEAQALVVKIGEDLFGIDLRLAPGRAANVSGIVEDSTGQPLQGMLLLDVSRRSGALASPAIHARPRADGRFEFPNVAPGDYVLQALGRGPNGAEFTTRYVSVADGDITGLALRTTTGSVVNGHLTIEGRRPRVLPRDFQFNFVTVDEDVSPEPGSYRAKIGDDWTFEYDGLFGTLMIRPAGRPEWLLKSIRVNGTDVTDMPLAFGRRDDSLTDVEVVMTNHGAELTGSAVDVRGQNASEYMALVFAADRERWTRHSRFFKAARSEPDGTFIIRGLPSGEYLVAAVLRTQMPDGQDAWQDPRFLEALVPFSARVTLVEGQTGAATLRLAR